MRISLFSFSDSTRSASKLLLSLVMMMSFALVGCSGTETAPEAEAPTTEESMDSAEPEGGMNESGDEPMEAEASDDEMETEDEMDDEMEAEDEMDEEMDDEASYDDPDEAYLMLVEDTLDEFDDSGVKAVADEFSDEEKIEVALAFCEAADEGASIDDMFEAMFSEAGDATEAQLEMAGGFMGISIAAGAEVFCPEYKEMVEEWADS